MTTNEKLVWRLNKLPTPEELRGLVSDKIITQKEAREVLFKTETKEDVDVASLKAEIKFLRELVDRLATPMKVIESIRYVEKPYWNYGWFQPYAVWCDVGLGTGGNYSTYTDTSGATTIVGGGTFGANASINTVSASLHDQAATYDNTPFTEIKTF